MSDKPAERLAELPEETREFLSSLSKEDIETFRMGLPVFRKLMGTGQVLRWLGLFVISLAAGIVLLGESISKILSWLTKGFGNG